ncbi:RCC1 domain-containing protein [Arsenicibacter rosenii]|uniref:RCC1-like domain-containing protein n=1 Tax=Arsenicibacter rosenii TaxID=1750698 RepID=A0A1S2VM98_9BACT|nr:hypothetical protein [Arsenicibacter rosenii]OIN59892.1 hypothetical protein BLX24_08580 [Arsenicibacter rosenii]
MVFLLGIADSTYAQTKRDLRNFKEPVVTDQKSAKAERTKTARLKKVASVAKSKSSIVITRSLPASLVADFTGLADSYCADQPSVLLTGNQAPAGKFLGIGVTDNGNGTATFDPATASAKGAITYIFSPAVVWSKIAAAGYNNLGIKPDGSLWQWGTLSAGKVPVQVGTDTDWKEIAVGGNFFLGIKTNGTLWAWGYGNAGQLGIGQASLTESPVQVGTDTDWKSIAAGQAHAAALKTDGSLWSWGFNQYGQVGNSTNANQLTPLKIGTDNNWTKVFANDQRSFAIKTDGTLWGWGRNNYNQLGTSAGDKNVPTQVGTDTDWMTIAPTFSQTFALKTGKTLWVWGYNGGRFGNGTNTQASTATPVQIGTDTDWKELSAGHTPTLVIKDNGSLWGFGNNYYGQVGDGTATTNVLTIKQIGTGTDWKKVANGDFHSVGMKSDGTVWVWGYNGSDRTLGNGTNIDSYEPMPIAAAVMEKTVEVGPVASVTLTGLSTTYCSSASSVTITGSKAPAGTFTGAGITDNGDGTATFNPLTAGTSSTITYTYLNKAATFVQLSAGYYASMGIKSDGTLWGWGYNGDGNMGNGNSGDLESATQIGNDLWKQVSTSGYATTLGIKRDGTLWAWGYNSYGTFGDGTTNSSNDPVKIGNDTWKQVSAGYYHSMGIKADGTLWGWGYNGYGELGNGSTTDKESPTQVGTDNDWAEVSAGYYYTLARKTDGSLWAWGSGGDGQLGNGATDDMSTPVKIGTASWKQVCAGEATSLAIRADGTLWGWGYNGNGHIGNGTYTNTNVPVQVGSDTNWDQVVTGVEGEQSLGIKTNGTLWGWGDNGYGGSGIGEVYDVNVPTQVGTDTDWKSVAAGNYHSIGIKKDGILWGWGYNEYGEVGNGVADGESYYTPILSTANTGGTVVCASTASQTVTMNSPSLTITAAPSLTIALGQSTTLTATGATSYTWSTSSTDAAITASPTVSTNYSVSATGDNGCVGSTSATVSVDCGLVPAQAISPTVIGILGPGNCPITVNTTAVGNSIVFEGPGGFVFSNVFRKAGSNPVKAVGIKQPGIYKMTTTSSNACGQVSTQTVSFEITGIGCN